MLRLYSFIIAKLKDCFSYSVKDKIGVSPIDAFYGDVCYAASGNPNVISCIV